MTLQAVCRLLVSEARPGTSFLLLGDIFEYWVGDDHITGVSQAFADACRQSVAKGARLAFMAGNRDFLVGEKWLTDCGIAALPDPWHGVLMGVPTLLSHGDLLCTDDHAYQAFRQVSRNPVWQRDFLSRPLSDRVTYAQQLRAESMRSKSETDASIMDVNPVAVERALAGQWPHGGVTPAADRLIHGHTHRPATHVIHRQGLPDAERIVLPDWDFDGTGPCRGYALEIDATGVRQLRVVAS